MVCGVSVGAMGVATLGYFVNGRSPAQYLLGPRLAHLAFASAGPRGLSGFQRWARTPRLVGKPVLIMGAGMVGAQVARRLESHPDYGLMPVGFLDEDPGRSPRSEAATSRSWAPSRTSRRPSGGPASRT